MSQKRSSESDKLASAMLKYPKGKAYVQSIYQERPPTVICDGIRTKDLKFAQMCHSLADGYKNIEVQTSSGKLARGFSLLGNLNQVLQDSSYLSNPLSSVPRDLPNKQKIDADYERIFGYVSILYGACWDYPDSVRVNRLSRSGYPSMDFQINEKLKRWMPVYSDLINFVHDGALLYDKKLTHSQFIEKWGFSFIKTEGRRYQETDKINFEDNKYVPRQREVFDWEGKKVYQNRSISYYPKDLPMFSVRDRLVWGYPVELSIFSGYFAEGNRKAVKTRYPYAQHHIARNLIYDLTNDGYPHIVAGDVSNFDQHTPLAMMRTYFNNQTYMSDVVKKFHHNYAHSLSFIKNSYLRQTGHKLIGSLGHIDYNLYGGHPSGYAYVSNFNEVNGYAVALTCAHKSGIIIDSIKIVEQVLKGLHHRFRVKAKGDDHIFAFKNKDDADKLRLSYAKWSDPYSLKEELPAKFLGSAFFDADIPYVALDDRNYVVKFLVPEKSKTHIHNMLWKLGWEKRRDEYNGPASTEMHLTLRSHIKRFYDIDIDDPSFVKMNDRERAEMQKRLSIIHNMADLVFLQDPSIIYKKDIIDDISQEVLNTSYLSLQPAHLTNFNRLLSVGSPNINTRRR